MSASIRKSIQSRPGVARLILIVVMAWLLLQNTLILGLAASVIEWSEVTRVVSGLWTVAETLVEVAGSRLSGLPLLVFAGAAIAGTAVVTGREARHA